jgi:hypothetical protein
MPHAQWGYERDPACWGETIPLRRVMIEEDLGLPDTIEGKFSRARYLTRDGCRASEMVDAVRLLIEIIDERVGPK